MAAPKGWKETNGQYESKVKAGDQTFTIKSNGEGKYELFDSDNNKVGSQDINDKNFQKNDGVFGFGDSDIFREKLTEEQQNSLLSSVKSKSYNLATKVASEEKLEEINTSNAYAALAQKEKAKSEQQSFDASGYQATDVGVGEIAAGYVITYPLNIANGQDKIKFTAVEIEKDAFAFTSIDAFSAPNVKYKKVDDSIYIGTQGPIQDQTLVSWGEGKMDAIQAFKYNAAMTGMTGSVGEMIKTGANAIIGAAGEYKNEITQMLAGQAAGINNILSRTKTKVLNPNLELLFEGPQLRPFTFQFEMSARDAREGQSIRKIIKYFKRHMAVRKEGQIFLKAPHVFTIQYLKGQQFPHPSINLISPQVDGETKACALQSMNVDYTPLGQYATYNDDAGTMVKYTINLTFQEIEPLYDTDYFEDPVGSAHEIGY